MPLWKQVAILFLCSAVSAGTTLMWHPQLPRFSEDFGLQQGEITMSQLAQWNEPIIWVDARSEEEYDRGHIEGAMLLNEEQWDDLLFEFVQYADFSKPVVVYCSSQSCSASHWVAEQLREILPHERIYVLKGGWEAWQKKGG